MDINLASALSRCSLSNGVLSLPNLSVAQVTQLNEELREALLESNIPHYRVIASYIGKDSLTVNDYITKPVGANKSYAELLITFRDLIFAEGMSKSGSTSPFGKVMAIESEITSSNDSLFYEEYGMNCIAKCLIKDVNIIKFTEAGSKLRLFLRRGIGVFDFNTSYEVLPNKNYKVARAVYDLNNVFCIHLPKEKDNVIRLMYKENIEECILEKIFQEYGKDLMSEGGSCGCSDTSSK